MPSLNDERRNFFEGFTYDKILKSKIIHMENPINLSILLPGFPLVMALFIFILLQAFNRTINRLTKPVSFLAIFAILSSTILSLYMLLNHVEGEIFLTKYFSAFNNVNLEFYINSFSERIIIAIGLISSLLIIFSLIKLPRKNGYVLYIVIVSLLTSILMVISLSLKFPFR